jgi:hypothetical protein
VIARAATAHRRPARRVLLAGLLAVGCASASAVGAGCSRDDKKTIEIRQKFDPQPPGAGSPVLGLNAEPDASTDPYKTSAAPWPEPSAAPVAAAAPAPVAATPAPAPPGPPPDPDAATRERTRVAAGGCFSALHAGPGMGPPELTARIDVTIVPTGTVSRAEVSTAVTDPGVLACLRQTGQDAVFSDNNGGPLRTYAIDVRVIAH